MFYVLLFLYHAPNDLSCTCSHKPILNDELRPSDHHV